MENLTAPAAAFPFPRTLTLTGKRTGAVGGRRGGLVATILLATKLLRREEGSGEGSGHPLNLLEIRTRGHVGEVGHGWQGWKGGVAGG